MLKQEIRRVLHSPFFYVSIIILVFADFPVMLDQFEMSNELTYLVDVGWGMGYGSVLYPLLCVLTTAESYLMGISIRVSIFLYVQNKQDEICGYEDGSGNRHRSSHCSAVPSALFGTDGIDRL